MLSASLTGLTVDPWMLLYVKLFRLLVLYLLLIDLIEHDETALITMAWKSMGEVRWETSGNEKSRENNLMPNPLIPFLEGGAIYLSSTPPHPLTSCYYIITTTSYFSPLEV